MNADVTPMNAEDVLRGFALPTGSRVVLGNASEAPSMTLASSAFIGVKSAFIGVSKAFRQP